MNNWLGTLILVSVLTWCESKVLSQKVLVDRHNFYRSFLALGKQQIKVNGWTDLPPAKYMAKMVFDKKLAEAAQACVDKNEANGCTMKHCGYENLAMWSGMQPYGKDAIGMWFGECEHIKPNDTDPLKHGYTNYHTIGHFIVMTQPTLKRVGCGMSQKCKLVGCAYGWDTLVTGNGHWTGLYAPGKPCSLCKGKCVAGLCEGSVLQPGEKQMPVNPEPTDDQKSTPVGCKDDLDWMVEDLRIRPCKEWAVMGACDKVWKRCKKSCNRC